jgi:NAD(P)H-hydrate epimerase
VRVFLFARPEELAGDAAINYRILDRSGFTIEEHPENPVDGAALRRELVTADWVVDALFGTGLAGPIGSPLAEVVEAVNASNARILAVDIPSGLDCDTGLPLGPTVRAQHTVTFVAPKKGFACPVAQGWLGKVHVVDIGAPHAAWGDCLIFPPVPVE